MSLSVCVEVYACEVYACVSLFICRGVCVSLSVYVDRNSCVFLYMQRCMRVCVCVCVLKCISAYVEVYACLSLSTQGDLRS